MALYRLEMQNVSRSDGVSSVAKAAYRHRSVMIDERTGEIHGEKSANRDDLVYAEILAPEGTPDFLIKSSNDLWNYVEKTEKRKDARTAKEFKITLPCELTNEQNIKLLKEYLTKNFVSKGIICDFVIHNDKDNKNPHAHVMITTREITLSGFGKKVRSWDEEKTLHDWRKQWAKVQNQHLKNAGLKSRVSHRTLEEQKNIMIDLAKKAEDAKDFDKSILYLAKAIELDRPPMQNMSRKKWRSKEGQEQRKRDQAIRDRAKQDARAVRLLRGVAVVDVASFVVHPLEKKEHSKNNDFSVKKSWWRSTVN
ncbi:TPA: MobQ family relaxase, partial [Enterobacter kobei]